ncbi:MAG: type I restriction enzyme HsdR N-terminal domain-containing protein [Bacteroidales bacterium]|nr:type I restriction enzyme HsdR N-terminal domain-containing protein [Bacteroidales bacterium]
MQALNLPTYSFKIKSEGDSLLIFDEFRKKNVVLTPEEWVRQNFAKFLVEERGTPAGRVVIEKSLSINKLTKRCDILIYGNSEPLLLVECKSPEIKISQAVFDQIAVYNMHFKLPYLVVTNGLEHYCSRWDEKSGKLVFLEDIPSYETIRT